MIESDNQQVAARPDGLDRRGFLRLGAGAAAVGAVTPLLASCGGSSGGGSAKELTFWNFYGPAPDKNPASKWFVKMASDWNDSHDVKVKLRYIANKDYVSGNTLQSSFAAGSGPDIFLLSPGDFLRYYNGGVLKDLTPSLKKEVIDDFLPGTLDTRKVDDKIFAVPMESEPLAIYYSKKLFDREGIKHEPRTWDELLDVAKQLTTKKRFGMLFEPEPSVYQNFTWYPYMWQGGGAPVDKNNKGTFDSDPVRAALKLWGDSVKTGVAPKKALGTGSNDAPANLASGYCAMQETGIWSIADLKDKNPDFDYGIFPLPTPPGGKPTTIMGGWAFCANAKGGNPDAAAEFIAWALGSMDKGSIERGRTWNTGAKSNIPVRASVQKAADARGAFDDPNMKFFAHEIAPTGQSEPRYPPKMIKAISNAIQNVQLSGEDSVKAAKTAAANIDNFLKSYKGAPIL
ncbi:ABC transporter substrate-binding protein [Spelaeicoccus albus]|uniref:ABC transporter substrate-binding protein n=1 Tax=Spelaeicoccus albus TaxID=1280376 RepID=UPI001F166D1E|nr:sugar ABC transporter substrate-binding protein [Spelaeicoccus albus]